MTGVPATGSPNHTIVGIDRPDGTVRLYASRVLKNLNWWQAQQDDYTTAWQIHCDMQHVLIVDAPDWMSAYRRVFEIWANQDRANEIENNNRSKRKAITGGRTLDGPAHGKEIGR